MSAKMPMSVSEVVADKTLIRALFEFASTISDQALIVSLVSIEAVLKAEDEFAAQARRLLSTSFGPRGPFLSNLRSEIAQHVNVFRQAVSSDDITAARQNLQVIRRAIADDIDAIIMPDFRKQLPSKRAIVDCFDDILRNPDYLAHLALFALKDETSRQALLLYSHDKGDQAKQALSRAIWPRYKESDIYASMSRTEATSRSTLRALRKHPIFQGLVTTTANIGSGEAVSEQAPIIESIIECFWKHGAAHAEVVSVFPQSDEPILSAITTFCFPLVEELKTKAEVRSFSFILTRSDGTRRYASCRQRRAPDGVAAVCVLSSSPEYQRMQELVDKSDIAEMRSLIGESPGRDRPQLPDVNIGVLFQLVHPLRIMSLLEAVLLEQNVLFISNQLNILSIVGETIRWLISPFQISAVYVPVLPNRLVEALQCPTSFLIGMHTSVLKIGIDLASIDMMCVADLDNDRVWSVGSAQRLLPMLPVSIRAPILHALRRVCFGQLVDVDFRVAHREITIQEWRETFQKAVQDLLLFEVKKFAVVVPDLDADQPDRVVVVFDPIAFVATKPKSWHPFLHALFSTASFASFLAQFVMPPR